jgi:CheY-like chemotaxis protein
MVTTPYMDSLAPVVQVADMGVTTGLRILVVEDEPLVAMLIVDFLKEMGHETASVANDLEGGLEMAGASDFDLAILDLNLHGKSCSPIVDLLLKRNRPFLVVTGYGAGGLPEGLRGSPTLTKPFLSDDLARAIGNAVGSGS